MTTAETIVEHLRSLPDEAQREVLGFVEYIEARCKQGGEEAAENAEWSALSLASALRDMEDEDSPYTLADLRESFK